MTPTQFAWRSLKCGDYPPPDVKRGEKFGPDQICWLCAGDTRGIGWPLKTGLAPTFTDFPRAKAPFSTTVCQECVAMSQSEGWGQYVNTYPERGLNSHFPVKAEGKSPRAINWLHSSHVFTLDGHESPNRARIRDLLIDPPRPPFLFIIAVSAQKQVVFKGQIADSRDKFAVQADDERVYVDRIRFAQMMRDFEAMYAMGFSRDSIAQNRDWNQARIMRIGISAWKSANEGMDYWRRSQPQWVSLAAFCAQRPADWVDPMKQKDDDPPPRIPQNQPPAPASPQASLF